MTENRKYGGRGRPWNPRFIEYMSFIAHHKSFKGMPDAFVDNDRIQWEAPSNRASGRFMHTHTKRREWWRKKALELGIDPNSSQWISRVAKTIHPTKKKPCKICGRVLSIQYVYPQARLLDRVRKLPFVPRQYKFDRLEPITDLIKRLVEDFGNQVFDHLPSLLSTGVIQPPNLGRDLEVWQHWLDSTFIPKEPRILSPGVMSNAPDRFDGFHSDNLCCRSKADKGRSKANLASYTTDRRVFEYWSSGDWVAADRLMGQIRAVFKNSDCMNGHLGPCSADHIGPLSLGFCHRPEFQLLCRACNSAKNNRMMNSDVVLLKKAEARSEKVISWHSEVVWNDRKKHVTDNETALRLSKLLRDNRHTFMSILQRIATRGHFSFLVTLLELDYADFDVNFKNLRVVDHITRFHRIIKAHRKTKYAVEQKARRCRVAFDSLRKYFRKISRNAYVVSTPEIEREVKKALAHLDSFPGSAKDWDKKLASVIWKRAGRVDEEILRETIARFPRHQPPKFIKAKRHLVKAMALVGKELAQAWESDRYVRG